MDWKRINIIVIVIVIIFIFLPTVTKHFVMKERIVEDNVENLSNIEQKPLEIPKSIFNGELYSWMGKDIKKFQQKIGQPIRKDLTPYGYVWWIFKEQNDHYIQVGEQDGKIVTIYAVGNNLALYPLKIGQSFNEISSIIPIKENITFTKGLSMYQFKLSKDDLKKRPLVQVSKNVFLQLYFDHFTEKLSSIRLLSSDILLTHHPYEVNYRGNLPKERDLSLEEWNKVERGMEQQVLTITNMIRERYHVSKVTWDNQVAKVAFDHSIDMANKKYFSHFSPDGKGLRERLFAGAIYYLSAGENIAAQYPDAPAVVEGWLNSEGHRKALLNNHYNYLGVGVYRYYYTQNFLEKPSHAIN